MAELMAFSNLIRDSAHLVGSCDYHMALCTLCTLLAPMAPHIASEMWVELREAARQVHFTLPQVCIRHYKIDSLHSLRKINGELVSLNRVMFWSSLGLSGVKRR